MFIGKQMSFDLHSMLSIRIHMVYITMSLGEILKG